MPKPASCFDPSTAGFNFPDRAKFVETALPAQGLFADETWRISPEAFPVTKELVSFLRELGPRLQSFSRACNTLYRHSIAGKAPGWIASYLELGKPASLMEAAKSNRLRSDLPFVIRPDVLLTEDGIRITELDSVPGGIGLTDWLNQTYGRLGNSIIGDCHGMAEEFARSIRHLMRMESPCVAIVVSEEAATYRPEMEWLAGKLNKLGLLCQVLSPEDLRFHPDGVFLADDGDVRKVDVIYRFFELFDLPNIAGSELMLQAALEGRVVVTPPFKPQLEEKMWFAFFWHSQLQDFWRQELGERTQKALQELFPYTWIMDPAPLPPHAVIPQLEIVEWAEMQRFTQKNRELIIKASGFSPDAWGSRSVVYGRDVSGEDWAKAIQKAVDLFPSSPRILQRYHKPKRLEVTYVDLKTSEIHKMDGRARLCPYYFVRGDETVTLAGILGTVCPADKKIIHGMTDAVILPCQEI